MADLAERLAAEFQVSDMAVNRNRRMIAEIDATPDPVERITTLILSGVPMWQVAEGFEGDLVHLAAPQGLFKHGVRVAVRSLLNAGVEEEALLGPAREQAVRHDLASMAMMEARAREKGNDIADYYFDIDGGNEVSDPAGPTGAEKEG